MAEQKAKGVGLVALKGFRFNGHPFEPGDEFVAESVRCGSFKKESLRSQGLIGNGPIQRTAKEVAGAQKKVQVKKPAEKKPPEEATMKSRIPEKP